MATTPPKDTIYIDVDDEITGIIDKLRGSNGKIVALVLPKRATVFQSIVNMKLLKRAADEAKKHLVLITTENGLLPLAGMAGVLVAPSLTSKPEVPAGPAGIDDQEMTVDEATGETELDTAAAANRPIGELAGLAAAPGLTDDVETIDMEDESGVADEELAAAAGVASTSAAAKKLKKDKKLAVPNFERFRLLLVLGSLLLIALIIGLIYAFTVLPKATIAITTDATNVNTNLNFTADSQANAFNPTSHVLPAKLVTQQKTYTEQAAATGQKNNGQKATGTVTVSGGACSSDVPADISQGTPLTYNNLTYIFQDSVSFTPTVSKGKCVYQGVNSTGKNDVPIAAQSPGSNFNTPSNVTFIVYKRAETTAVGSATGGSDNITKIVSQADIDNAKAKITTSDNGVKATLQTQLVQAGLLALQPTFASGAPVVTTSVNAGDAADNVTVTEVVSYTMLGVQQADLKSLIDENVKKQIDTNKQSILDEGLRSATFTSNSGTATSSQLSVQTVAVAGPQLNVETIRKNAVGKKSGEVIADLRSNPDVTDVNIKLSPFFVSRIPSKTDKITVTIAKPKVTAPAANANNP